MTSMWLLHCRQMKKDIGQKVNAKVHWVPGSEQLNPQIIFLWLVIKREGEGTSTLPTNLQE